MAASGVMAGLWPLCLRSLPRSLLRRERVMMSVTGAVRDRSVSGLGRDGRTLAIASQGPYMQVLRQGARYRK